MNLWDKDQDYYDPVKTDHFDELKHDDECPTCMRTRNGTVGRNTVRRPDGVITFGSPFVTFEKRWGGMLTATDRRVGVPHPGAPALGGACVLYLRPCGGERHVRPECLKHSRPVLRTALFLILRCCFTGCSASMVWQRLRAWAERWFGKGDAPVFAVAAALQGFKYLLLALLVLYYVAYATVGLDRVAESGCRS